MTFSWSEREFIADMATAVKWRVEALVEAGQPFDVAKQDAIRQAERSWKHLTDETRQALSDVCWSMSPADLSKRTHRSIKDQLRASIEKHRGRPMGLVDRLLFRLTGSVW